MQVQLARLHNRGDGNAAPATAAELDELGHVLGVALPSTIRAIYEDHRIEEPGFGRCLRLLSPTEAGRTIVALREFGVPFEDQELGTFWTDDNSNYAGVFASGPPAGRLFKVDHDETSPEPCWRSVESFYDSLLDARDAGVDWSEMETDYPRGPADVSSADDALASRLFTVRQDQPDSPVGERAAYQALALSSATHAEQVMSLMQSDDMWVQERAVQILGHWRWEPAVAGIVDVVRNGQHNGRIAGILTLKRIGSRDAGTALRSLRTELGDSFNV